MTKAAFTILLLFPIWICAQSNLKIGYKFSPDFCSQVTTFESKNFQEKYDTTLSYSPKFGFTTGLFITDTIRSKMEIEYGLMYSLQSVEKLTSENSYVADHEMHLMQSHYILAPVKVNFLFGRQNCKFVFSCGLTPGIGVLHKFNSTFYDQNNQVIQETYGFGNDYPQFILNGEAGIGICFFQDNFDFRLMPTVRYSLIGRKNDGYSFYPLNAGINLSVARNFAVKKKPPVVVPDDEIE